MQFTVASVGFWLLIENLADIKPGDPLLPQLEFFLLSYNPHRGQKLIDGQP